MLWQPCVLSVQGCGVGTGVGTAVALPFARAIALAVTTHAMHANSASMAKHSPMRGVLVQLAGV
jgi:hypothetical protein